MEEKRQSGINVSLPNLINICVDEIKNGEISGRIYHYYDKEPELFYNAVELLMKVEELFDKIRYPQASTRTRQFNQTDSPIYQSRPPRVADKDDVLEKRGKIASFATGVRFRQNSTWQGDFVRLETGEQKRFANTLSFLKLVDHELSKANK